MNARHRLPAEWAPQSGVMLTWPHDRSDWRPWLPEVDRAFAAIGAAISQRERLLATCRDAAHTEHVQRLLRQAGAAMTRVACYQAPSNDSWTRDHGPITVFRGTGPVLLDFIFNGWGGKYEAGLDDALTRSLHAAGAFGATPLQSIPLVLEGGSIDSDGEGTLLTTARCLLSPGRNPGWSRAAMEAALADLLGSARVLWLEHGWLAGDDTDGHVDTLARFCDPQTIAYVSCTDPADEHFQELAAMARELAALRTAAGRPYHLVPLPLPAPKHDAQGQRLPATYANFLVVNGAVLVPTYRDPADAVVLERLAGCFSGREIVAIDCLPLIQQYGSLHCVTMQLPEGVL